jgi:hypothetical protein
MRGSASESAAVVEAPQTSGEDGAVAAEGGFESHARRLLDLAVELDRAQAAYETLSQQWYAALIACMEQPPNGAVPSGAPVSV